MSTVRVHELARELGVTSKEVLAACKTFGEYVKSASSVVDQQVADAVRLQMRGGRPRQLRGGPNALVDDRSQAYGHTDSGFGSVSPWRLMHRRQRHRGEISQMTQLILDRVVLPRRDDNRTGHVDRGTPWADEVEEAHRIAGEWGAQWFTPYEVAQWLQAHRNKIEPTLARRLADAGISPEQAAMRIWYGKINNERPSIAIRVARGDITPDQARREVGSRLKDAG